MALNGVFLSKHERWRVLDLNEPPYDIRAAWRGENLLFDATTCVVSVEYLKEPLTVLGKLREATKEGGTVHLVISNRCFPNKVVSRWSILNELMRLEFVGGKLQTDGGKRVWLWLTFFQIIFVFLGGRMSRRWIFAPKTRGVFASRMIEARF